MKRSYLSIISALSVCAGAAVFPPGAGASTQPHVTIRVFASDAIEQPLRRIGYVFEKEHPNAKLHYEFSASGVFYTAIVQGVPPDIFISSGSKYQNKLSGRSSINLPSTVGYDYLAVATPCRNPVQDASAPSVTESNVVQAMLGSNVRLAMADPELSPAGARAMKMFAKISATHRGAVRAMLARSRQVLSPAEVLNLVENGKADMGIVYASQITGRKKMGACIGGAMIPKKYNSRAEFTISILKKSKFHFVSANRRTLDRDYRDFVLSDKGQKILGEWGFVPASGGNRGFLAKFF